MTMCDQIKVCIFRNCAVEVYPCGQRGCNGESKIKEGEQSIEARIVTRTTANI